MFVRAMNSNYVKRYTLVMDCNGINNTYTLCTMAACFYLSIDLLHYEVLYNRHLLSNFLTYIWQETLLKYCLFRKNKKIF